MNDKLGIDNFYQCLMNKTVLYCTISKYCYEALIKTFYMNVTKQLEPSFIKN